MNRLHNTTSTNHQRRIAQPAPPHWPFRTYIACQRVRSTLSVCRARSKPVEPQPQEGELVSLPEFQGDEWPTTVTDWYEYWNYQRWDEEIEDLDDDDDSDGFVESKAAAARRIQQELLFWRTNMNENNVMKSNIPLRFMEQEVPEPYEEETEREVLYRNINENDLRAIAEKRRWKALMDEKVQREVSRPRIPNLKWWRDVRIRNEDGSYELPPQVWTHESCMNLITLNGRTVHPSKVPHHIKNPYVNADYSNQYGVKYVEETEEFLERLGHWGPPNTQGTTPHLFHLPTEIEASSDDIVGSVGSMDEEGEEEVDE